MEYPGQNLGYDSDGGFSSLRWVGVLNGVSALVFGETTLNPIRV